MALYAQIIKGKIHWIGDYDEPPDFHPSAGEFVDISKLTNMPKPGWDYRAGVFSEPLSPEDDTIDSASMDEKALIVLVLKELGCKIK